MRFFKVALILLFLFMVGACSQAQQMSRDVYKTSAKIELKLKNPDYNRVMELLEKGKTDYPDDAEIWFLLGKVYGIKHRDKDMVAAFAQADKLGIKGKEKEEMDKIVKEAWFTTFNLGVEYGNQVKRVDRYSDQLSADWSKYQTLCDSFETMASKTSNLTYNWKACTSSQDLPLGQLKQGLYQKALEQYELAILLDSTHYEPFVNAAFTANKLGDTEKAMAYFKKAYEMKPEDPDVLGNYFSILLNNKKYEEALKVSDQILKIDPDNTDVLFNRTIILDNLGRTDETMKLYDEILLKAPDSKDVYFNRGLLYLNKTSQVAKDLLILRDSLENSPKNQAYINRSHSLIEEQKSYFSKAESDFAKVLQLSPDDLESMRFLGYCYLNEEKPDKAIEVLEKEVQMNPDDKEAWGYLSVSYAKKGMVDKAKEAQKKAE
ncbi:MAG TPA: tetratricopeptide repeat protein [Terriglobales bacterium]|nr:tetratricopeptide repeat protein [Terriglobales bacterium]